MENLSTVSLEVTVAICAGFAILCWRLFTLLADLRSEIDEKKVDKEVVAEIRIEFNEKYKIIDSKLESKLDRVDDKVDKISSSLHELRNDLQRIAVFSSIKNKEEILKE